MIKQILNGLAEITESSEEIKPDIMMLKFTVVNAFILENRKENRWFLIDTGLESSDEFIVKTAENRFGEKNGPAFILLTHGHFDHVGSVKKLSEYWDAPVYANLLELPYLTGEKDYPKGNPNADEGLVAKMSTHFPNKAINLGEKVHPLPGDGSIPHLPEWRWLTTPGHTEGHISLYRERDKVLIVGDAFTGTKQESLFSVTTQREKVKGPPAYFTPDWETAKQSVIKLKRLKPAIALFSHGKPLSGVELQKHLDYLTENFDSIAVPKEKQ